MKNVLVGLAAITFLAGCDTAGKSGPVPLAKHFMAEFYGVDADAVHVNTDAVNTDKDPRLTVVLAKAGQHVCRMEMSPAPSGVSARFGWLVTSMQCGQGECKPGAIQKASDGTTAACAYGDIWKHASNPS